MAQTKFRTFVAKKGEVDQAWFHVDATDQVLGRLASEVACLLRGKRDPKYTPNVDTGEYVVIVNAEKVKLTGKKLDNKMYYNHSGYNSGLRIRSARKVLETKPTEVIQRAVRGMLPKGPLGYQMIRKLKVYAGADHPHEAQKPEQIEL